jgi:hypothetical protein
VARERDLVLVCVGSDADVGGLLTALQETAAAGGDGRVLARRTARVLADSIAGEPVACAVAGPTQGGLAVLVSGTAAATVTTGPGEQTRLDGAQALTWTDRLFPGPVAAVDLALPDAGPDDARLRLDAGVVSGGGLRCVWSGGAPSAAPQPPSAVPAPMPGPTPATAPAAVNPPQPATPPTVPQPRRPDETTPHPPAQAQPAAPRPTAVEPAPPQVDSAPFESVILVTEPGTEPAAPPPPAEPQPPEPDPRPLVAGVDCKNGHFNDPTAPYCALCGISMAQRTLITKQGPRPPLGVLVIDDGMTLRLDVDYLIGRDPERSHEVRSGHARPVRLVDLDGSVSRRHVRVALDGWNVTLVDLGSVNGTRVQSPSATGFQAIPPNQPVPLVPGTKVLIGGSRTLRYESHRKH